MLLLQPNPLLWTAIEHQRMIQLLYHGKHRILEPHDHGILNGSVQLLAYQVGGSSSRPLPNWVLLKTNEITDIELLDRHFSGGRPTGFRQTSEMGQAVHPSEIVSRLGITAPRRPPFGIIRSWLRRLTESSR
jgi:hypothetical protein